MFDPCPLITKIGSKYRHQNRRGFNLGQGAIASKKNILNFPIGILRNAIKYSFKMRNPGLEPGSPCEH
jgi:hypothetical protein